MHVFIRRFMLLLQIHNKNSNNYQQIMKLKAAYEIHNQFDHSLNAGKWNEVPKWSGVTVSQLI